MVALCFFVQPMMLRTWVILNTFSLMIAFVILAVFIAGLMIGRTPEYLGKKIEAHEMKMAMIVILISPVLVLLGTAVSVVLQHTAERNNDRRSDLCNGSAT